MSFFFFYKIGEHSQSLVAHACNPIYSGGSDQEDHGTKPAKANSLRGPISKKEKKPSQKKG
jgi:hypothetical protein